MGMDWMSMIDADALRLMISLGKEAGLKSLRFDGISIDFGDHIAPQMSIDDITKIAEKIGMEHGNPTEDELLFMSSPLGPPDLAAEKPS